MAGSSWIEIISSITSFISSQSILDYGAPILALILFVGALGVPIPCTALVLAAGAMAQQGLINAPIALALGLAGVVFGDSLSYAMGRVAGMQMAARLGHTQAWNQAHNAFTRQSAWLVFLSRWLLTPLALPVNVMAGSGGIPFGRFLRDDAGGELTWLLLYGGLGYGLGSRAAAIAESVSAVGQWIVALGLVVAVILVARRPAQRIRQGYPSPTSAMLEQPCR